MLNRLVNTEYSRVTTIAYRHEYPITVSMVGICQMSRLNARCLHMVLGHSVLNTKHDLT